MLDVVGGAVAAAGSNTTGNKQAVEQPMRKERPLHLNARDENGITFSHIGQLAARVLCSLRTRGNVAQATANEKLNYRKSISVS